ncbi:DUF3817 domain-containing protein [Kingella kingae]|uniref:DUF3817 domain-containing protein n=1 Tax=Kingella kingae TaxID=504 RepID=UPI0022A71A43|nr:DUF3817 domain-containing protein [Kingella kingae]
MLRAVGFMEGLSCLGLFAFTIPMRYFMGNGEFIRPMGMTHGVLFLAVLLVACHVKKWSLSVFLLGLVAAIIPFGTFIFDHKIKHK